MLKTLVAQVLKLALPALGGALGVYLMTDFPAVYNALCGVG